MRLLSGAMRSHPETRLPALKIFSTHISLRNFLSASDVKVTLRYWSGCGHLFLPSLDICCCCRGLFVLTCYPLEPTTKKQTTNNIINRRHVALVERKNWMNLTGRGLTPPDRWRRLAGTFANYALPIGFLAEAVFIRSGWEYRCLRWRRRRSSPVLWPCARAIPFIFGGAEGLSSHPQFPYIGSWLHVNDKWGSLLSSSPLLL